MAEYTDISELLEKRDNAEQKQYVQDNGIPLREQLPASQFINQIVRPIMELQNDTQRVKETMVTGIKQGVTTYLPDANGIVTMPGADTQVGVFLNLQTNRIVSVTGKLEIGIRATSTTGGSNTGEVVEIQVMTAAEGSTDWSLGGKFQLNTKRFDSNEWDVKDLTEYVGNGAHNVQLIATGQRTGVSGYSDTFTAVLTTMRLVCQQSYQTAIDTSMYSTFPVAYTVYGAVAKNLHIKIYGSIDNTELVYSLGAEVDSQTQRYSVSDTTGIGLLSHGVHKVEAWLEADDGQGNVLMSDKLVNRFMVVNRNTEGADLRKPYLLIQNELSSVTNFVQATICDYAVYSPNIGDDGSLINDNGPALNMVFLVTAYSRDYLSEHPEEYYRMEQRVDANTTNSLNVTVEIEPREGEEEQQLFNAYLRAYRVDGDRLIDMMTDSVGENNIYISVDNTDSFAPMSGADFVLNPKVRNNTESHPMRILNARKNNAEIASEWENFGFVNDGWITNATDGQKVLRVPAGSKLKIAYNPFSQFLNTPNSSMTFDLDFAVRNMTDEDEQVFGVNETVDNSLLGLIIRPITGVLFTASNVVEDESDFRWQEDKRVHISINIHNSVNPDLGDAYKPTADTGIDTNATSVALIRVFVNGNIEREMKYSTTNRNEFLTADASVNAQGKVSHGIVIGSSSADIDIYSMRCYKSAVLEAEDVQDNWVASLPTSEEKLAARRQNALKSSGRIDIEKVKALGRRCLVWHGAEPYYYAADAQRGWWEIFQYNTDGTLNRELSGTIAKETKRLKATRQGSTANTYYYSNLQTKVKDLENEDFIRVNVNDLHSSIILGEPYAELDDDTKEPTGRTVVDITGGNLGKNYPIENKTAPYEYITEGVNHYVMVPDGWVDGNGKYRGLGYIVTEGTPMAQKLVNKINYASPMQSHLCGCTRAYSDLHKAVVGKNSVQEAYDGARTAKYTEPFYFFTQNATDPSPVYRGPGTFGGGKADKPTWGYVKKKHPMMMMVEGSDNNYTMTDFRCPWDSKVTYNVKDEGWMRAGLQHWDFDMGDTDVFEKGTTDEYEVPKTALTSLWRDAYNFIYMHAPMLMYYVGTFQSFINSKAAENTTMRYWCTEGSDAYRLKRFDDVSQTWVDAGLETETAGVYEVIDLRTHQFTKAAYEASTNKSDFDRLNSELIAAIVADYKKYLGWYFKPASVRFHYCFINHLMAGTDNCSKNTYYVSDPKAVDVTIDGVTKTCYLFEMHQDDVDTIGPTDNNGRSTKPYYIDRMHPFSDKDLKTSCYEGNNSAFFNLCELAFEGTLELQNTMQRIFDAMSDIMSSNTEELIGFDGSAANTVWGFFHKYFFNIQHYFSATAYNEAARIRYEYPAMINYTSRGPGARGIAPITQSVGPQMQSEIQYYRRRLVLMASYADWGDFYDGGKTHKLGISEAADSFPLQAFHLPDSATSNTEYKFTVRPHQYIYPTGVMGQTAVDPHVRLRPNQEYVMSLGTTTSNDTGMSLLGINYYKSIGNIGDLSVSPNITVTINGKRLTEFVAEPTKLYEDMETGERVPAFRPGAINVTSTRLTRLSLSGCKQIGGTLNAKALTRLEEIDVRNTNISNAELPQSTMLRRVYLGRARSIELSNMPQLEEFMLSDYSALTSLTIGENVGTLNSQSLVTGCYNAHAPLASVSMRNVSWTDMDVSVLMWLTSIEQSDITGVMSIYEGNIIAPSVTFEAKSAINLKWGNVDDADSPDHKGLKLIYAQRRLTSATLVGNFYNDGSESYQFAIEPQTVYDNTHTKIVWETTNPEYGGVVRIDERTGKLYVTKLSLLPDQITISATIHRAGDQPMVVSKNIEIWDRQAKEGDYVFADGTFSDTLDPSKTVVGCCFYVAPRSDNGRGDIIENLFNKNDRQQRLMVAAEEVVATATAGNRYDTWQWGCYPSTSDSQNGLYYRESNGAAVGYKLFDAKDVGLSTTSNTTAFYDVNWASTTSAGDNITTTGLSADPTNGNNASYIGDNNLRGQSSTDEMNNNGWKVFATTTAAGDGFAYNEASAAYRTLDAQLAALAGEDYHEGDIINMGYARTLKIIKHRNAILNSGLPQVGISPLEIPQASATTTELTALANLITSLRAFMADRAEQFPTKWSQICYPAASAAYAYQPAILKQGEVLSDKFKAHNWFLPSSGQLHRLYWYYRQRGKDAGIFDKAVNAGVFTQFRATYHWSSTEYSQNGAWGVNFANGSTYNYSKYNSYVVRAVAAF